MARCGGIRVLLHALAEGPPEVTPLLASVFLHIIDSPTTRSYLSPGTDLEVVIILYPTIPCLPLADRLLRSDRCLW
jgi:hypothetical protein